MNYSTLKKGLAVSFVALIGATSLANAQETDCDFYLLPRYLVEEVSTGLGL